MIKIAGTDTNLEEIAREDFLAGQTDAISSLPRRSRTRYYRMGYEDALYEKSLGRVRWYLNEEIGVLEPIEDLAKI